MFTKIKKKIRKTIELSYKWYTQNIPKLLIVAGIHVIVFVFLKLPYFNIFIAYFSFLPFIIDLITIIVIFHPRKEHVLMVGIGLFAIACLSNLVGIQRISEWVGDLIYFLILSYVLMSLKEIRRNND